jgi:hypothetical protein
LASRGFGYSSRTPTGFADDAVAADADAAGTVTAHARLLIDRRRAIGVNRMPPFSELHCKFPWVMDCEGGGNSIAGPLSSRREIADNFMQFGRREALNRQLRRDDQPLPQERRRAAALRVTPALRILALTLVLGGAFAAIASAQDAAAPSAGPQNPLPAAGKIPDAAQDATPGASEDPVPEPGTGGQAACIAETGDYVAQGKAVTYVIGLENKCDKPLRCEIFANVTGVKGMSLGHAVLILGAKSSGAAAKKSYVMKVKAVGGTAQVSRSCRVT